MSQKRETFASNFGLLMTMIGVAVGLGAVWRFPYMVGKFGGAAFVLYYTAVVFIVCIPALMAEWILGRYTKRGTLGAYEKGGFPGGKYVGIFFYFIVFFATAYYSNAVGWVAFHALGEIIHGLGFKFNASKILPPQQGFNPQAVLWQLLMTAFVIFSCGVVLVKGLRKGIEKVSKWAMPALFFILLVLISRALTLPRASQGIRWYIGGFQWKALTPSVMAAAMGMAFFSMSLGGTFMVIYGSYLDQQASIPKNAVYTGIGASLAGLLAGLAIFPGVFSFGLEPSSGPDLIFSTLPKTFAEMPIGWLFGFFFYAGLFSAAYLSDVAAFEVLIGGLTDNTKINRKKAVIGCCFIVFVLAIPSMINFRIFVPWDLTFGSGMQVLGSLFAVVTSVWFIKRAEFMKNLSQRGNKFLPNFLYWWMRIVVPITILFVGISWLMESVFHLRLLG